MRIDCICPPKGDDTRHPGGDEITFREALDFRAVSVIRWEVSIQQARDPDASTAEIFGALTELYVLYGVASWTLVDERGKPIEVTKPAIRERLLTSRQAQDIGDEAERAYREVMLPLLQGVSPSSPPTPTAASTSATSDESTSETGSSSTSSATPRKRSRPSSISTIPTVATETTTSLRAGDSSSSQNSTTAA